MFAAHNDPCEDRLLCLRPSRTMEYHVRWHNYSQRRVSGRGKSITGHHDGQSLAMKLVTLVLLTSDTTSPNQLRMKARFAGTIHHTWNGSISMDFYKSFSGVLG
jgi:hypothetical protein